MLQPQPSRKSHSPEDVIGRLSLALCLACQSPAVSVANRASCLTVASLAHQHIICGDTAGYRVDVLVAARAAEAYLVPLRPPRPLCT